MKSATAPRRLSPLPCGCLTGPGILLGPRCKAAERLWGEVQALADRANSLTPEWVAYRGHFKRARRRRSDDRDHLPAVRRDRH